MRFEFGELSFPSVCSPSTVAVVQLADLLRISVVPGSNVGPAAGYPDRIWNLFLSPSRIILQ